MKRKGWIKLAEAFISILIIGILLSVAFSYRTDLKKDLSNLIETQQISLLDKVQINDSLRSDILKLNDLPKESNNIAFPSRLTLTLKQINTNFTKCEYKICAIGQDCILNDMPSKKEVFIHSRTISSNQTVYNPRSLNLFCWEL